MSSDYSKIYESVTNSILAQLEQGIIPWRKPWKAMTGAYNAKSKRYYSMLNQWVLLEKGAYASYKQWKELKCQVKKGAKASYVMEWFSKKIESEKENENGEIEKKVFLKWYPRMYPVFHESQVEGYTSDTAPQEKPEPYENAERVINAFREFSGISRIITDVQSDKAFYSPVMDFIQVPNIGQYENANEYYSTLFHEMTHSTGHTSRLNRELDTKLAPFGSEDYSKEELIAELGSAMCLTRLGIDNDGTLKNSSAYIQSWLGKLKNDKSLIVSASSYAESATRYIFND